MTQPTIPDLTPLIVDAIQDRKGRGITVLDLSGIETAAASTFIVCQGNTPTQVAAIADSIRDSLLERAATKPFNYDGYRNSQWIVLDYGHVLVHIFVPDQRAHYNLEELWADAPCTVIADLD